MRLNDLFEKLNSFFTIRVVYCIFSEFVWTLHSSVLVVFNNFLLKGATNRSKISSDQHRLFYAVSIPPLIFREHPL